MSLTDAQRWVLALPAIYNEANHEQHDVLGGVPRPAGAGAMLVRLGRWWDVFTPADAERCLAWLAESGHRVDYAEAEGCSPEAFAGWDYVRMAAVAGWSYRGYLLEREVAWSWMERAARGVQETFGSFAELGRSYLRGLAKWSEEPDGDDVRSRQQTLAVLLSREGSPFLLPFRLDVAGAPPPIEEVREIHVAEGSSIAAAIEEAGPNGRVLLGPGVFRETLRPKHPIEIVGAGAERTLLEGDGKPALFVDANLGVRAAALSLKAARSPEGNTLTAVYVSAGFVRLEDATVTATHHGLYLRRDGDAHVFRSQLVDCGRSGVEAEDGNFVILDSEIRDAGQNGVTRLAGATAGVIDGSRISGASNIGVYLKGKGQNLVRGCEIEAAGQIGLGIAGGADVERTRVSGSKGWGLFVDEGGHAHVKGSTFEGSARANVDLKHGYASLSECVVRGAETSGVILQPAARALILECEIEDNAQGNVFAMDGARHLISGCRLRGGAVGFWSRGSVGYLRRCLVEGSTGNGIDLLGEGGPVIMECEIREAAKSGVEIDAPAAPLFSRCKIGNAGGAGFVFAAGSRPAVEDTLVADNGAPDAVEGAAVAVPGDVDPELTLPSLAAEGGGFAARRDLGEALTAVFAARGALPPPTDVSRALMIALAEVMGSLDGVTVEYLGTTVGVAAADQALAESARDAVHTLLRQPHRLRAALDHVGMMDFAEALSGHDGP